MSARIFLCLLSVFFSAELAFSQGGYISNENQSCQFYTASNADKRTFSLISGTCRENYVSGIATIKVFQNNAWFATFKGNFTKGVLNGEGTAQYFNNDSYTGTFVNGARDRGTYTHSDGRVYTGAFRRDGKKEGNAVQTYPNGDSYSGNFYNDGMSGVGKYRLKNGVRIEGIFENDQPKSAIIYFTDNTRFEGAIAYVNGSFYANSGFLFKPDGTKEYGEIKNTIFYKSAFQPYEPSLDDYEDIRPEEPKQPVPVQQPAPKEQPAPVVKPLPRPSADIMSELEPLIESSYIYSVIDIANNYWSKVLSIELSKGGSKLVYSQKRRDARWSEMVFVHRYIIDLSFVKSVFYYTNENMIVLEGDSDFIKLYQDIPETGDTNILIKNVKGVQIFTRDGMEKRIAGLFCELVTIHNPDVYCEE